MRIIRYNASLHRIALLTAAATFPLIFMGGLVTSHGAGMSVPDWPNSYGYSMFLFPPRLWIGGILYEHTHRLMGTVVGMLSILLAVWAWKIEPRLWVRWLALAVLEVVILQGVLGGLRVVLVKLDLAIVHACLAQAFFCLTALMAVVTSRWWMISPDLSSSQDAAKGRVLIGLSISAVIIIYLQLIAGAIMRHYEAGLAIPDLPLVYGHLLPPVSQDGLNAINHYRDGNLHMNRVSLGQIWLHFSHRIGAIFVSAAIIVLAARVIRHHRRHAALLRPAIMLCVLLLVQLTLGILTVLLKKPADIASSHVAVGALVLLTSFVLAARAFRLYSPRWRNEIVSDRVPLASRPAKPMPEPIPA